MNSNTKELNLNEMENVSGGILGITLIAAIGLGGVGLIGYGIKKGIDENKK